MACDVWVRATLCRRSPARDMEIGPTAQVELLHVMGTRIQKTLLSFPDADVVDDKCGDE